MAITKYKTLSYSRKIEPVEVTRETEQSVFLVHCSGDSERREAKISDYAQYHDSWADAHAYLLKRAEGKVLGCRAALESANGELGNIKDMKQPDTSDLAPGAV